MPRQGTDSISSHEHYRAVRLWDLYLVVGYDGSPPASRALDAAVSLLHGRTGRIEVVYVAHLPSIDMLSAGAVAEMEASFGDVAQELRKQAGERPAGEAAMVSAREAPTADQRSRPPEGIREA